MLRPLLLALLLALATIGAPRAQESKPLVIALAVNINTLDPHMSASFASDLSLLSHIYPSLVIRGPDLQLAPALAQSWTATSATTWRFALTPGASFANGEKLDAAAVKWNFDRVRDPKVNARIKAWFDPVKEVRVISETELEVETSTPMPALPAQLSMFFLLPPAWTATHNPTIETMSGGRYELADAVPGDHYTLRANPLWWGAKPAYPNVVFRVIPEAGARIAALLAGEVDLITGIPPSEIPRIRAAGATADAVASTRTIFIKFNTEKPPFDNKLLRQAINYAIDKQGIVDSIFDGRTNISPCEILTPAFLGYNPALKPYPYDPARARALLAQSGIKLAAPIEIDLPSAQYLQGEEVVQAVAAQLDDIGIRTKIVALDFGAFMAKYLRAHEMAAMALISFGWPTLDADGQLTLMSPGNIYAYWNDAAFGKLVEAGRATADPAARIAAYRDATARMCEEAPVLFLYTQPVIYGASRRIAWQARGDDWVRAFDITPR